ncbi:hypothetical protein EAX61_04780 [Dokdonia sinensis]|uniref:Peptidase C14 caspase domain-containing protein n=1 Tax=Dokdonia sinensis TaxID=2479847 RepID=A0A3M0GDL5_9FLAO|nr:caspase family protein [Dokdonia sinensis]RMB62894.1 hypothetical protein EAX61_04780 [Dokdonia sinensis]
MRRDYGNMYAFAKAYTKIVLVVMSFLGFTKLIAQESVFPTVPAHHSAYINKIVTSPNEKYVATLGSDGRIKLWATGSKNILADVPVISPTNGFFTADSKYLAVRIGGVLQMREVPSLKIVSQFVDIEGACPALEGSGFYYVENKYASTEWRIYYQKSPKSIPTVVYEEPVDRATSMISGYARWLSLSPDGSKLMFTHTDHKTFIYDLPSKEITNPMNFGYEFLPNGNVLSMAAQELQEFQFYVTDLKGKIKWNKKFALKQFKSDLERLYSISTDEERIYFATEEGLLAINYINGKELIYKDLGAVSGIGSTKKALWVGDSKEHDIELVNPKKMSERATIAFKSLITPTSLTASRDAMSFFTGDFRSKDPKMVTVTPGGVRTKEINFPIDVTKSSFGNKGKLIATSMIRERALRVYDLEKEEYTNFTAELGYNDKVVLSDDGSIAGLRGDEFISFYDIKGNRTILQSPKAKVADYNANHPIAISPDNSWAAVMVKVKRGETIYFDNYIAMFDLNKGEELYRVKYDGISGIYAISNTEYITVSNYGLKVDYFNASSGKFLSRKDIRGAFNSDINDINAQNTLLASVQAKGDRIFISDLVNGTLHFVLKGHESEIENVQFLGNDFLISSGEGNELILWDIHTGERAGNFYLFEGSKDWAFVTPQGHFDGSQTAIKTMYYVNGDAILPLEQLYEGYYIPNLLGIVLDHKRPEDNDIDLNNLKPAPFVALTYKDGSRNLTVEDDAQAEQIIASNENASLILDTQAPEDKIIEIRLYHNDKRVIGDARNLTVEDDVKDDTTQKTYNLKLLPGKNVFKAIAVNSQKTESPPAILEIVYEGKSDLPLSRGIVLHSLTIGIDTYKNGKYNLNYAKADATSFEESIKQGMMGITKSQNATFIKDTEATKEKITQALKSIAQEAQPQDIFIFYYAGHGVMNNEKEFYIVPTDVTQLYGNDTSLAQKGISASDLKELSTNILAQKQLYILDACQSAGALNTIAARGAAEEKAIAQLARSTGTHWLTASGSEQFATEFAELGHGVFTYALLEALSGKADSGDKRITVNELKAYLESRVPEISEKYKGSPQYPSSFGFGQDFPVSLTRE